MEEDSGFLRLQNLELYTAKTPILNLRGHYELMQCFTSTKHRLSNCARIRSLHYDEINSAALLYKYVHFISVLASNDSVRNYSFFKWNPKECV